MGPFEAIVVLIIVGFLMLAAEVFVPGMVLGLLGGLCLSGAVIVAFLYYDAVTGSLVFVGVCVLTIAGFIAWMAAFPHTAIGRRDHAAENPSEWRRRARVSLRLAGSPGPLSYAASPRGLGIHRRQKGGRRGRESILSPVMSRSSWFARRGCGSLFEKRCSRIKAKA